MKAQLRDYSPTRLAREALWIAAVFGLAVLLASLTLGIERLRRPTLDVQLHNTYFVVGTRLVVGLLFLLLLVPTLLVRSLIHRHTALGYWLLGLGSLLLLGGGSWGVAVLSAGSFGWTVYPALNSAEPLPPLLPPSFSNLLRTAYVVQLLALLGLIWAAYRLGQTSTGSAATPDAGQSAPE